MFTPMTGRSVLVTGGTRGIGKGIARTFLQARPELVTLVECGDTGRPDDIDTPADLARITAAATERA